MTQEEAQKYAEEEGLLWGEASAKSGENVQNLFAEIGERFAAMIHVTLRALPLLTLNLHL